MPNPGPARITLMITPGISAVAIAEIASCIRAIAHEDELVIASVPVDAAPISIFTAASSDSALI